MTAIGRDHERQDPAGDEPADETERGTGKKQEAGAPRGSSTPTRSGGLSRWHGCRAQADDDAEEPEGDESTSECGDERGHGRAPSGWLAR